MTKINRKQDGFTIIELVVVILLLGILAATALPRFMDVTAQANAAVIQATGGALTTGAALYRAQWTAEGSVAADTPDGFSLPANAFGYPDQPSDDEAGCLAIANDVLQAGSAVSGAAFAADVCTFTLGDSGTITYAVDSGQAPAP